jgi:cell wall-associated NlpC family hydrolase|tara:strand:- start:679 stop:1419 length:741 start_codon:yes stop_codon:yes gene_type:complete
MTKFFTNTFSFINLYKKNSIKSEIVTQLIYGESFSILKKNSKWLKIKIKEDNYKGYIQNKNFKEHLNPTHKIYKLKAKIYRFPSKQKKLSELTFGSKIRVTAKKYKFFKFKKGWIDKNDLKPIDYKEKNLFKKIQIFKNIKYKWGGTTFRGIDCSGLLQVCLKFNNKYCPRDAKDQVKYFKKKIKLSNIKKNDLIFWKGHVAVALTKKKLIHAYGPLKKTLVMDINKTIERISVTANLKVLSIKRI